MESSDSENGWSDVDEDEKLNTEETSAVCLFCPEKYSTVDKCVRHMAEIHNMNLTESIQSSKMDFYQYIKYINFIRTAKPSPLEVKNLLLEMYADEKYMQPVLQDDLMLQYDIDSIRELQGDGVLNNRHNVSVSEKLAVAEERAKLAEEFLERTLTDLNLCQKELQALLLNSNKHEATESQMCIVESNDAYYSSYAHFGIHEEMLKDIVRTESYKEFILNNPSIFQSKKVLDVGCGTSVLSMFAAKAGASMVWAVDNSDIAYQAMAIVKENDLDKIISVFKGKAEDVDLPGKVDVIISEWMGYFLLFESMLDTVLYCRDQYLSEGGCIYPDHCNIQLVALDDEELYSSKVNFWDNVHGFNMSAMKSSVIDEPLIYVVDASKMTSEPCVLKSFDLMKVKTSDLDFDEGFTLRITRDCVCSAIVGYFDVNFQKNASKPIMFSTGPNAKTTHWKQTVFLLNKPVQLKVGDKMNGRMICKKNKEDHRALDIAIIFYNDSDEVVSKQFFVLS